MAWFSNWWDALTLFEQILYCVALPASLLLVIKAILIIVGAGDDGMDGGDFDYASGPSEFGAASMFTVQGVASFLCVFGWGAILMSRAGLPIIIALPVAFATGAVVMVVLARIMFSLTKLAHVGTLDTKILLGAGGTVYLKIPPKGQGKGKVSVQTSERLVEFDAVSESAEYIPNETPIRVVDILGENVLVVEKTV